MRVADYIAQEIVNRGIKDVFLLSGGGIMHLLDGLAKHPEIKVHCHNHEQDAGIAAEAYARIKRGVGVCYVTSGPGLLNAVEAIAECWIDSVPVIFIAGQSNREQTGRYTHIEGLREYGATEIDHVPIVQSITKATYFIDDASKVPSILAQAWHTATNGRPGPVVLSVPLDIQKAEINPNAQKIVFPGLREVYPSVELDELYSAWMKAQKPLIIAGQGLNNTMLQLHLQILADSFHTPVVTTQAAKDILPFDSLKFVGHFGLKGDKAGNHAVQNADFILTLGCSLHVYNTGYDAKTFAPNAAIYSVELDAAVSKRQHHFGINTHVYSQPLDVFFSDIMQYVAPDDKHEEWRESLTFMKAFNTIYDLKHKNEPTRLNIYNALKIINDHSNSNDIIISDSGSSFYTVGQAWQLKQGQRFISSNGLGTMGWSLPASTGAWVASGKRIICITGDGSFMTGLNELSVMRHKSASIKLFILNNNGYVSIRNTQDAYFNGDYIGTDPEYGVPWLNIEKIAYAHEIPYINVRDEDFLDKNIDLMLNLSGTCIINLLTNTHQEIIPTVQGTIKDGIVIPGRLDNMYPYEEAE